MKKERSFEENLKRLEEIVQRLESGEETLDGSLALYEEGARLSAACYEKLNQAQQKVTEFSQLSAGEKEEADEADGTIRGDD